MPDDMQTRLAIRRRQHEARRAEIERAMRVGAADAAAPQWAKAVTIRAALGSERTARHAAYRIPPDHPAAHRLEQLHAGRHFDPPVGDDPLPDAATRSRVTGERLYANACAVLALYHDSGLGRSGGVAAYLRTCRTSGDGDLDRQTAEDVLRDIIETGGVEFAAVLMLVRGDPMLPYMWGRCLRGLDKLDWLPARYDGERWRAEKEG